MEPIIELYITPAIRFQISAGEDGSSSVQCTYAEAGVTQQSVARALQAAVRALQQSGSVHLAELALYSEKEWQWRLPRQAGLSSLRTRKPPSSPAEIEALVRALCQALSALHETGLGAYDLAPDIIFVGRRHTEVVLIPSPVLPEFIRAGFGARGDLPGVAPELFEVQSGAPDPIRADLFALGSLVRRLLYRHSVESAGSASNGAIEQKWAAFIDGCCRTNPTRRFASLDEALASLDPSTPETLGTPKPRVVVRPTTSVHASVPMARQDASIAVQSPPPAVKPVRRRIALGFVGSLLSIATVGVLLWLLWKGGSEISPFASYKREFGTTISKYASRSYEGAAWEELEEVAAVVESVWGNSWKAMRGPELEYVTGWDSNSVFVAVVGRGVGGILQLRDGGWTQFMRTDGGRFAGEGEDSRIRLIDRERGYAMFGYHMPTVFWVEPGLMTCCGVIDDQWAGSPELLVLAEDLAWAMDGQSSDCVRIVDRTVYQLSADKDKACFVHSDRNVPIRDRDAGDMSNCRVLREGVAVGINESGARFGGDQLGIVEFRDGIWILKQELGSNVGKPRDVWIRSVSGDQYELSMASRGGRVTHVDAGGRVDEQSVPAPASTTSMDLISIWGVDRDQFWVMDRSGTVWEWSSRNWREVVRGMYDSDVLFKSAWVSPTGEIFAISEKNKLYRL